MTPGRRRLSGALAATLAIDLLTLGVALRWHWALGPPHTQASPGLMVAFGLCAALLGLSSIVAALAALHWLRGISGVLVGVALMGLYFHHFLDWDAFLIWQLLVTFGVQTVALVLGLLAARSFGFGLALVPAGGRWGREPTSRTALRLSISDLLLFTGAIALVFGVLRGLRPVELGVIVYAINIAGGCGAALVGSAVLWACFGSSPVVLRGSALVLLAPIGGLIDILAARYASLLFSWPWCAGVTTVQVLFMTTPCLMLRASGFRFVRRRPPGDP